MDLLSPQVVGWANSGTANAQLSMRVLRVAVESRKPAQGVLFHSNQGCQDIAKTSRDYLASEHILQSKSRRGNCEDNAIVERIFRTLEAERIHLTHKTAIMDISQCITEFYNTVRLHSTPCYTSPVTRENGLRKVA